MARSKFTAEQEAHISTYFDELAAIYNAPGLANWKVEKANEIVKSALFVNQLPSKAEDADRGAEPQEWIEVCSSPLV